MCYTTNDRMIWANAALRDAVKQNDWEAAALEAERGFLCDTSD